MRIITGTQPLQLDKLYIGNVVVDIPAGRKADIKVCYLQQIRTKWENDIEDWEGLVRDRFNVPEEAVETVDPDLTGYDRFETYRWTWYEITIKE